MRRLALALTASALLLACPSPEAPSGGPIPPPAVAPSSAPAAAPSSAPVVAPAPTATTAEVQAGGFAPLREARVMGASCSYDFAPGQGLEGRAFEHDGEETWVGVVGRGDLRLRKEPDDGSFGGDEEQFVLPDGAGRLVVRHDTPRMTLSGPAAGTAGTVTVKLTGGCGD